MGCGFGSSINLTISLKILFLFSPHLFSRIATPVHFFFVLFLAILEILPPSPTSDLGLLVNTAGCCAHLNIWDISIPGKCVL